MIVITNVYRVSRTRSSKCTRIYGLYSQSGPRGGGRVYKIKTLRSNLAPDEGEGRLFEGGV